MIGLDNNKWFTYTLFCPFNFTINCRRIGSTKWVIRTRSSAILPMTGVNLELVYSYLLNPSILLMIKNAMVYTYFSSKLLFLYICNRYEGPKARQMVKILPSTRKLHHIMRLSIHLLMIENKVEIEKWGREWSYVQIYTILSTPSKVVFVGQPHVFFFHW